MHCGTNFDLPITRQVKHYLSLFVMYIIIIALLNSILHVANHPTYTNSRHSKEEIRQKIESVFDIFNIPNKWNEFDFRIYTRYRSFPKIQTIYQIKNPKCYKADSCKCSTKPIYLFLTRYLNTEYSEGETSKVLYNNILQLVAMWIRYSYLKTLTNY